MVEIDFRSSTAKCRMLSQEEFIDAKKQSVSSPNKEILQLPNGDSFRFAISGKGSEVTIEKIDPTSVSLPSPLLWVPYAKVLSVFTENGIVCAVDSLEHLHLMESPQFQKELPDSSAFSSLIFKVHPKEKGWKKNNEDSWPFSLLEFSFVRWEWSHCALQRLCTRNRFWIGTKLKPSTTTR